MMFYSKFSAWVFYAILAISFTPALLQPNDEQLLKLVKIFNQKVENINVEHYNGIQAIEEEVTDETTKILTFMASISNKWHHFFVAFEDFINGGATEFYSNNVVMVEQWKELAERSSECISELADQKDIATFLKLKAKITSLIYDILHAIEFLVDKSENSEGQTQILKEHRAALINEAKLVEEFIKLKSSNMEDRLNTKYKELVESIREIELIVQNKIGSKMMAEMAVKVKDDFEQRKIHLSKPEFKYAETRQNIEQLKGQRIGMPTVVELEDFFKLKEKVDPSQIAKIHRELNEIEGKFNKNHGERLSTDQLDMLETKGRLLSNFLKFLKQTISENKVFLKLLAQQFSHIYEKKTGSADKREIMRDYQYNYDYMLLMELIKKFKHLMEKYIERAIRNGSSADVPIYHNESELAQLLTVKELMVEKVKLLKLTGEDEFRDDVTTLLLIYNGCQKKNEHANGALLAEAKMQLRQGFADAAKAESVHVHQTSEYLGELLLDEWDQMRELVSRLEKKKQLQQITERKPDGSGSKKGRLLSFIMGKKSK